VVPLLLDSLQYYIQESAHTMEKIPDVGAVPSLAVYPPVSARQKLPPKEWESYLDTWIISVEFRLRLSENQFSKFKFSQNASGIPFLLSYLAQYEQRADPIQSGSKEAKLHHQCYFLLKRLLLFTKTPFDCPPVVFSSLLGCSSLAFQAIPDWKSTLKQVWKRNEAQIRSSIESCKSTIIEASPVKSDILSRGLHRLSSLVRCLPEAAVVTIAGVDFLEAVAIAYSSYNAEIQKLATECLYLCLKSFMIDPNKHTSLLLDTLFNLKSEADRIEKSNPDSSTLFSNLVCSTPFLRHLKSDSAVVGGSRGQGLIETLSVYKQHTAHSERARQT
jgi:activating signal cointegrator complex subunit 2